MGYLDEQDDEDSVDEKDQPGLSLPETSAADAGGAMLGAPAQSSPPVQQAAQATPGQPSPIDFAKLFDPKALAAEEQAAQDRRQRIGVISAITSGLANQHVAGEYLPGGHINAPNDSSKFFSDLQNSVPDPWERRKNLLSQYQTAIGAQKAQIDLGEQQSALDPNSKESQLARANVAARFQQISSMGRDPASKERYAGLLALANDPTTSAAALQKSITSDPLLKEDFSAILADKREQAAERRLDKRIGAEMHRDDTTANAKADRANIQLAKYINQDPVMVPLVQSGMSVQRGLSVLNSDLPFTPQRLAQVDQDFSSAINGSGSNAASEQHRKEISLLESDYTNLKQRLLSKQIDIGDPQIKQQFRDLGNHLNRLVQDQQKQRADMLTSGFNLATPMTEQNKKNIVSGYGSRANATPDEKSAPSSYDNMSDSELDAALLKRAKGKR